MKEDIYVGITKCLTNYIELGIYVTYETNITNIKKVRAFLTLPIEGKKKILVVDLLNMI